MTEPVSGNWQKGQVSKSENSREETEIVRLIVYLFMRARTRDCQWLEFWFRVLLLFCCCCLCWLVYYSIDFAFLQFSLFPPPGNIIHFSSPMRKFEPNTATVLPSAHGHGTLHRRYIGHSYLANDGPSPSSSSSNATTSSLFATLPRGTSGASTNAVLSSAHAHLSGSNILIDAGNKQQQSYIYIQHLAGPETESPANDGT